MFRELFENKEQDKMLDSVLKNKDFKAFIKYLNKKTGIKNTEITKGLFKGNKVGVTVDVVFKNGDRDEFTFIPFKWDGDIQFVLSLFSDDEQVIDDEFETISDAIEELKNSVNY